MPCLPVSKVANELQRVLHSVISTDESSTFRGGSSDIQCQTMMGPPHRKEAVWDTIRICRAHVDPCLESQNESDSAG